MICTRTRSTMYSNSQYPGVPTAAGGGGRPGQPPWAGSSDANAFSHAAMIGSPTPGRAHRGFSHACVLGTTVPYIK